MNPRCQVRMRAAGWCYTTVTIIIWLCAVLRDMPLLYLLAATLLGPLIFSWRQVRRNARHLSVERHVPPLPHAGQSVVVELSLRNNRADSSAWAIGIADRFAGGTRTAPTTTIPAKNTPATNTSVAAAGPARVFFPHVAPGESRVESYLWQPSSRGRFVFDSANLSSCFPLGLFEAKRAAVQPTETLVVPRLGQLKAEWRGWCDRAGREAAGASQRRGLLEGDYYGLREWRPGDSRRWIHWRSSARQGSLTTLQFEQPRRDELFLVVDLWAPDVPTDAQRESVERALSFAATVLVEFGRRGDRVLRFGIAAAQSRLWLDPLRAIDRDELLETLAVAEPSAAPDLSSAMASRESRNIASRTSRGSGSVRVSSGNTGSANTGSANTGAANTGAANTGAVATGNVVTGGSVKSIAGFWAVASTRPLNAEALARFVAAGMPRGTSPLWIDFSSHESSVWFAQAGES